MKIVKVACEHSTLYIFVVDVSGVVDLDMVEVRNEWKDKEKVVANVLETFLLCSFYKECNGILERDYVIEPLSIET